MFYTMNLVDGPIDTRRPFILHTSTPCKLLCCAVVLANPAVFTYSKFMTFQGTQ